jgi:hypothetical protein
MSKTRKWMVGVVCVVLMALLAPAALAVDFAGGGEYVVDYALPTADFMHSVYDATVNFEDGSSLPEGNWLLSVDGSIVNIYDCVFGAGSVLYVGTDDNPNQPDGVVTFYGTEFAVNGTPVDPAETQVFLPDNVLSGLNANGEYFSVSVTSVEVGYPEGLKQWKVNLAWLGGPSVIDVVVDIKPDSADNTINLGSMGVIPVGILSTADFDATTVDPWTVELAGSGVAVRGKGSKLLSSAKDLNGDGLLDLEVKVETENLDPGQFQDGAAVLTGQTYDGLEIQGSDSITIVPE